MTRIIGVLAGLGLFAQAASAMAAEEDMQAWADRQVAEGNNLAVVVASFSPEAAVYATAGELEPGGAAVDPDTQFQIGSITKAFTNLLLAELVARGEVAYSTTIGDVLGDEMTFANPAVADITLEQLATHRSGLPRLPGNLVPADPLDPYAGYDEVMLLQAVSNARARQKLGDHYAYSNFGVGLLGYLLGIVHGSDYPTALSTLVLEPLGLAQTGFESLAKQAAGFRAGSVVPAWSMDDALTAAGGLWGSASDFGRLADSLLGRRNVDLALSMDQGLEQVADSDIGYGLTRVWHVAYADGEPVYWHNGGTGGYWSFFGFRPDTGEAIAILVSGDDEPTAQGLRWLGAGPGPVTNSPIDTSIYGQYQLNTQLGVGVYDMGGTLVAQITGQPALPLSALGDDWYAYDTVDASLHFRREGGDVVAVELVQAGVVQTSKRTSALASAQERETIELSPGQLEQYVGRYALSPVASFTIRKRDGGLEAMITGQPYLPIYPANDKDVFFYRAVDAELHFERDAEGAVTALVLHQGQIVQRAARE